MIETRDLLFFMRHVEPNHAGHSKGEIEEYRTEIIKRLQAYDELKKGIEKMVKKGKYSFTWRINSRR